MIELYTWTTPNGRKISIALEEMGLDYTTISIDITKKEQFHPDFLAHNPNNKIPVIRDGDLTVFESGAILMYLAQKTGQFLPPPSSNERWQVLQWLMWQMSGYGPMLGQAHHYLHFNPGKSAYAEDQFKKETGRLCDVLDSHLADSEFITSSLSIADFALWPWTARFDYQKVDLNDYPNIKRWYLQLATRPGFIRGYAQPEDVGPIPLP